MSDADPQAKIAETAAEPKTGQTKTIRFPRRFQLEAKINGNLIRKLDFLSHNRTVRVVPFSRGKTNGYLLDGGTGRHTFVTQRPTTAKLPCDDILYVPTEGDIDAVLSGIEAGTARWLEPRPASFVAETFEETEQRCTEIVASWAGKFEFREERQERETLIQGLRRPQIGALHATLAHWSVGIGPATIVMPTGTGKTETMLALLVCAQLTRVLVIVPTNALREQLTDKFLTLGILERCGCLLPGAALPVVASLQHRPNSIEELDDIFRRANVIVTTMQIAGQCDPAIQDRMAELCSDLFIDEAHHIAAPTWNNFKQHFVTKRVLQFTATPFRTDGKRVDGRFIYSYPLAKTQSEGYFKPIRFAPVRAYDRDEADQEIVRAAGDQLVQDLGLDLDHVLMARVDTIARAEIMYEIYKRELAQFDPVLIHSKTPALERRERLQRLRSRASRVVVCVDMFGEGFDFPELKIAALHDRHKSLAITLQFIGRFTRTSSRIGDATVIANIADDDVSNALRNLYAEDADWNVLLRILSQGASDRARRRAEILEGFTSTLPEIPLQTLLPRMSAVIYKTSCERWEPSKIEDLIPGPQLHAGPVINPEHNLAIFVTRDEDPVRWGTVKQIQNLEWNLYILHWNEALKLLFINSSKPKDFHEPIAQAVTGSTDRLRGESIFRSLGGISRLTLTNLGLSHAFGRNIRYTMFMGADIGEGLSDASRGNRRKSNLFGLGYELDEKVTIGCSFNGRLWSHRIAYDPAEWIEWCEHIGTKLLNESISTDDIFAHLIKARRVTDRPALVPIMVWWPEEFYHLAEDAIQIEIGSSITPFYDCELNPTSSSEAGPLQFRVQARAQRATFEVRISDQGATITQISGEAAAAVVRGKRRMLAEWFNDDPPIIHFATGDFLVLNELFEVPQRALRVAFDPGKIMTWDWAGVDLRKESQGPTKDRTSIQRRVIDHLLAGDYGDLDIIFDDDGSGEVADVVGLKRVDRVLSVHLFHCKFSEEPTAGARITDLYEVCGQAQKCIKWRENPRDLLKHLMLREERQRTAAGISRFDKGSRAEVQRLMNAARELTFDYRVYIVQPGLSKNKLTPSHRDVLGATETFLKETYSISLSVIASA